MYIEQIDPHLCTHIIYAFAHIDPNELRLHPSEPRDLSTKTGKGNYQTFTELKNRNPRLKTMLSLGGANALSYTFERVVESPDSRWVFIEDVIKVLRKYNFDGLDVDWEYPGLGEKGSSPESRDYFTEFIRVN